MTGQSDRRAADEVARRLRIPMALNLGPLGPSEVGQDVATWLGGVTTLPDEVEHFLTVDAQLQTATIMCGAETASMFEALDAHLGLLDATDDDIARVRVLGQTLEPSGVSVWVEGGPEGIEAGYGLHGALSLEALLPLLPESDARARAAAFATDKGLALGSELRVSVGLERVATTLRIPVPAEADPQALAAQLAGTLRVDAFASELLGVLLEGEGSVELIVGLSEDGVHALGVAVAEPSTETVITLVRVLDGVPDDVLATVEGTLGARGALSAELWRDADGERLRLTYGPLS